MVSQLVDLATEANGANVVKDLLRKENNSKETVLHQAVCIGDNLMVKLLLTYDSELARFPREGTSPLYLAILLEKNVIAQTLYDMSKRNILSYAGPNGQNALHAAVFRGKGTCYALPV
jgi:ankyrin repeat protein